MSALDVALAERRASRVANVRVTVVTPGSPELLNDRDERSRDFHHSLTSIGFGFRKGPRPQRFLDIAGSHPADLAGALKVGQALDSDHGQHHWITSSTRRMASGEILIPSVSAALRLTTSSKRIER